jgi:hypothetical protein
MFLNTMFKNFHVQNFIKIQFLTNNLNKVLLGLDNPTTFWQNQNFRHVYFRSMIFCLQAY